MISNRNVDYQQNTEYTLTELKNVKYPLETGCYGTHQENQILISCNEKNMLIEENKFEIRMTPYGSRQRSIYASSSNEHQYQSLYETQTRELQGADHKTEEWTVIGQKRKHAYIDESRLSMDCSFSPPLLDPRSMHSKLTKPIPSQIDVDNKKIVREMKEWFGLQHCTIKFFCDNILNIHTNHLRNLFAQPREFHALREAKHVFIKMYNWLGLSDEERMEMLKMNRNPKSEMNSGFKTILDENEPPTKIIRKYSSSNQLPSGSITAEKVAEIMNKPATYVDTKRVSEDLKEWLRSTKTSREWFAVNVMERAKRTLRDHLNNPKDWNNMVKGQEIFLRMHNWMAISENERQAILRFYKTEDQESENSTASPDESFRYL